MLTIIGISAGTFFLVLLAISTFLRWVPGMSGTVFGDGRLILLLSLLLAGGVGLNFLKRTYLPLSMVLAGAFGTFTFLVMLSLLKNAREGVWVGLFAALGVAGVCVWTAVRFPLALELPGQQAGQPSFLTSYGALLGSQTLALMLGVIYWIAAAIAGG
ncbi:MAG: hypothetical protein L0Z62_17535 [Gemmataceae bacterium]|nr:hypothetical protein [Gemmataceae bacterium]